MMEWLTTQQTAELCGMAQSSIRNAINRGKFKQDELKKFGKTWVVSRDAIKRVWGK